MKRVKALTNLGYVDYPDCPIAAGETAEVSDAVAARLVARKHGVILPPVAAEFSETTAQAAPAEGKKPSGLEDYRRKAGAKPAKENQ